MANAHPSSPHISQRRRDDNENKTCILEGGGEIGGREENRPKTLFLLGNARTIKC